MATPHEVSKEGEKRVAALLRLLRFHVERPRHVYKGRKWGEPNNENGTVDWLASKGNVQYAVEVKTTSKPDGTFILRAGQMQRVREEYPNHIPALALVTPERVTFFVLRRAWDQV